MAHDTPRVLVLDDSPTVLAQVELLLASRFDVTTSLNWLDANAKVHALRPAAVVIDWNLEGLKGTFLVTAFRMFFPELPIVMISGEPEAEAEARGSGADAFVSKRDLALLPDLLSRLVSGANKTKTA